MSETDTSRSALDRGLTILTHLSSAGECSIAELGDAAGTSRSATYRIVERLRERDFVVAAAAGRFTLGPAAARLAMAAVQSTDIVHVAPELLRALAQQTRETVGLGVPSGGEMVFVYRQRGPQSVAVHAELGARRPLHCTSVGKAYLSALSDAERRALLRTLRLTAHTPHTLTDRAALERDVLAARQRGWAIERGEFDESSTCCGAAVFDNTGRAVGAISVAGPGDRMRTSLDVVGPIVASTAQAISRRLGHNPDLHKINHERP